MGDFSSYIELQVVRAATYTAAAELDERGIQTFILPKEKESGCLDIFLSRPKTTDIHEL